MASDGKIKIDVSLDTVKAQKDVKNLEKNLDDLSKSGGKSGGEIDKSFDKVGSSASGAAGDVKKVNKELEETGQAGNKIKSLGKAFGALSAAAGAATLGIGALVEGTAELNGDLARLQANAATAGFDMPGVEVGVQKIASLTGEMDSAVETMSNLMATNFTDAQLAESLDYINGAAIKFSDTLKTEGIADGLQETFATGAAIGPFAELLERSGVNLDTFNAGLAQATANGTETNYVLDQLSKLGLKDTYDAYKQGNPALVAYNDATTRLQMAMAGLGKAFMPIAALVKNGAASLAEWATQLLSAFDTTTLLQGGLTASLPAMMEMGLQMVQNFLTGITSNLPQVTQTVVTLVTSWLENMATYYPQFLQMGVQIIVSLIQGIAQAIPEIINMALQLITTMIDTIVSLIPTILEAGLQIVLSLIDGIIQALPNLIEAILQAVTTIVNTVVENLPTIITAGIEILLALIDGILDALPTLIDAALEIIVTLANAIVDNVDEIVSAAFLIVTALIGGLIQRLPQLQTTGRDLVKKLAAAAVSLAGELLKAGVKLIGELLKGIVTSIPNVLKAIGKMVIDMGKEFKPSKFTSIGKDLINGLIKGINGMFKNVRKKISELAGLIPGWAKEVLGIHSPAREMIPVGEESANGIIVGLDSKKADVKDAAGEMVKGIVEVNEEYAQTLKAAQEKMSKELADLNKAALDKIYKIQNKASKEKRKLTKKEQDEIKKLQNQYAKDRAATIKQNEKEIAKIEADKNRDRLNAIKTFIDDKKKYDNLTLLQEAELWRQSVLRFKEGTAEYKEANYQYLSIMEQIKKDSLDLTTDYANKINDVEKKALDEIKAITTEYENTFNARNDAYKGFAGLFETVDYSEDVAASTLTDGLMSQVAALEEYSRLYDKLVRRGVGSALLDEVTNLGVDALPEIRALANMTDAELEKFSNLFEAKLQFANAQATKETKDMREKMGVEIEGIRNDALESIRNLELEWLEAIRELTGNTSITLKELRKVGGDAGDDLYGGLISKESILINKVREMARNISEAFKQNLDLDVGNTTASNNDSVLSPIVDKLRNSSLNIGLNTPNISSNTLQNISNNNNNNVVIEPAAVNLDGRTIGEILFPTIDNQQTTRTTLTGIMKGVLNL